MTGETQVAPATTALWSGASRAVRALAGAAGRLQDEFAEVDALLAASRDRGHFRPGDDEQLLGWFARFLTIRASLWELLADIAEPVDWSLETIVEEEDWARFGVGYLAACVLVSLDRFLLEEVAPDPLTQRKLNEGATELGVPRKQFTEVFEAITEPKNALLLLQAMRLRRRMASALEESAREAQADEAWVLAALPSWETALDSSKRRYLRRLLGYARHSLARRGASARQKALFELLRASGRVVAELRPRLRPPRVNAPIRERLERLLRPGDVLVTRYDVAASNLFLPGYWPHTALYLGSRDELADAVSSRLPPRVVGRWNEPLRVLEAQKDGVLLRPLERTLAVDAVAVIRPQLEEGLVSEGLARALRHEGKMYNFDFDFFRGDRLVCTEVIYRGFDGLGDLQIELSERAGRPTLSAEDLLDLALARRGFEPIAVYGAPSCPDQLVSGPEADSALRHSYSAEGART
ncbi:MAG: YiiX/YebB-like N1pC/P60 family cysteine hydrolase [Acidobacteriota bacterium]